MVRLIIKSKPLTIPNSIEGLCQAETSPLTSQLMSLESQYMSQKALIKLPIERKAFPMFTLTLEKTSLRKYKLESHSEALHLRLCAVRKGIRKHVHQVMPCYPFRLAMWNRAKSFEKGRNNGKFKVNLGRRQG